MTIFNEYKVINILNKDGTVNYYGKILSSDEANQYLGLLRQNILWEKDEVIIFGKHITTKRKVAWYGDSKCLYTYSNTTKQALTWTKELSELKQIVEELAGTKFNSCLLNLYHNGNEGMGWHSDDEKPLGKNKGLPFYCNSGSRSKCYSKCFWRLSPPEKYGEKKPMFDFQQKIFDTLLFDDSHDIPHYQKRHLALLASRGLGKSELMIRIMLWMATKDEKLSGTDMCIVTGNRQELAVSLINRMKKLIHSMDPKVNVFDSRESVFKINGVTIRGYPAHHVSSIRGMGPDVSFVGADECALWTDSEIQEVLDVIQGLIPKSNPYLLFLSTANRPNDLMDRIFKQTEEECIYRRLKMDWSVGTNNKMYTDLDIKKSRMSSSFQREMELRFVNKMGNTFLTSWIEKAKSFEYDPDFILTHSSRIVACDPAWGSSAFGIVVTDFRDGKICVLYADEYPNETAENMVDLVRDLYYKYAPVDKIFVDGSQISFIKSMKIELYDELREETDYQKQIQRYKDNNCDYTLNMKILPVTFTADSSKAMLSHVRSLLEGGYIMIDKGFEKLLLSIHTCVDKEGRVDKTAMTHSDVFDSLRMALEAYTFS